MLINTERLYAAIDASGYKKSKIAEACGLTPNGFRNCCIGKAEFKASHVGIVKELLNLSWDDAIEIFFGGVGA